MPGGRWASSAQPSSSISCCTTVESLQVRVRVSDEMAERQRRTAENASAGMYELLSGLVAAEEATRGQLSAELHDTAAQSLMLARSLLADVLDQIEAPPAQLVRATDYVGEAEDQVRAVMARTRPPALRDGDLARAVGHLRDDMASRYGLVVVLSWPQQPYPLSLVSAITVYRFFQEALLNVVKHADGDDATATLEMTEHELTATVVDAGPGFDPSLVKPDKGRHVGLVCSASVPGWPAVRSPWRRSLAAPRRCACACPARWASPTAPSALGCSRRPSRCAPSATAAAVARRSVT